MNEKIDKKKKELVKEIISSLIVILVLIFAVSFLGFKIFSGSFKHDKINTLTAGYLSFNYVESDSNVIKLISAMPITDESGKALTGNANVFDFRITSKTCI